jgi:hypothetical protein
MLSFQDFFTACTGFWTTERIYHYPLKGEVERSYTEYWVKALTPEAKLPILTSASQSSSAQAGLPLDPDGLVNQESACPGFAISFNTRSETGEEVSMTLKALFVPDQFLRVPMSADNRPLPLAAQTPAQEGGELIQGFYLRDEGYSEAGAIAGRFTYQPTRQALEMTTYYRRSVAVDQMRLLAPDLRLRTIVTYQRPESREEMPTVINLVGFGVEYKRTV